MLQQRTKIQQEIKEKQAKHAKTVLQKLVASFETPELLQNAVIKTFLDPVAVPQNAYSISNRILLAVQGASDARGSATWRWMGRFPRTWSKQVFIMIPRTQKIKGKDDSNNAKNTKDKIITTGFFFKGLYDVENTYGATTNSDVQYVKNPPKKLPPLGDVAKKWGVEIQYRVRPDAWGSYSPSKNKIQLSTDNAGTFFHELAHKAHEKIDGELKAGQDPQQEAVAQLCAGVLSKMYDQSMDLETFEYIKHYSEEDPKKAMRLITKVLHKTGQVLELILGTTSTNKIGKKKTTTRRRANNV